MSDSFVRKYNRSPLDWSRFSAIILEKFEESPLGFGKLPRPVCESSTGM